MTLLRCARQPHKWGAVCTSATKRIYGLREVLELLQFLQRLARRSRELNLATGVIQDERLKGNCNEAGAEAQEAADLQNRKEHFVASDNDVVDLADLFILVVGDVGAFQLARAIAARNRFHVDDDELDCL
jgi:hypothetical protein